MDDTRIEWIRDRVYCGVGITDPEVFEDLLNRDEGKHENEILSFLNEDPKDGYGLLFYSILREEQEEIEVEAEPELPEMTDHDEEDADKNSAEGSGDVEGEDLALERVPTADGGASQAEGSKGGEAASATGSDANAEGGEENAEPELPEMTDNDEEDADKNSAEGSGDVEGEDLALERVPTADGGASQAEGSKAGEAASATGSEANAEGGEENAEVPAEGAEGSEEVPEGEVSPKPPAT
ncbi:predicted protein, partial [Nematostella vectensis]